ncbi:MAG TPA: hypothetical protein VLL25_11940, partial [Acidimicrobiales bacterium]|nr:hypothetical protein [Acidimicrobiales bacterium]
GVGPIVASIARSYRDQIGGSRAWAGCVLAYIGGHHGPEGLARAVAATSRFYAALNAADDGLPDAEPVSEDDTFVERLAELTRAGDCDGALAIFDSYEAACRVLQDRYRDWLSSLFSEVYRTWGSEELEDLHRYCAERTLLPWMTVDIRNPPEKRLVRWVRMLRGHFSGLRVREDDEKFVIVQDPCGTCSRQILAGRYDPPVELAVVQEHDVVTWGRGSTPVYRTHVPVWHVAMARERVGVPWPVNRCPAGLGTGPCETFLYKDPLDPRANAQVPS